MRLQDEMYVSRRKEMETLKMREEELSIEELSKLRKLEEIEEQEEEEFQMWNKIIMDTINSSRKKVMV